MEVFSPALAAKLCYWELHTSFRRRITWWHVTKPFLQAKDQSIHTWARPVDETNRSFPHNISSDFNWCWKKACWKTPLWTFSVPWNIAILQRLSLAGTDAPCISTELVNQGGLDPEQLGFLRFSHKLIEHFGYVQVPNSAPVGPVGVAKTCKNYQ